MTVLTSFGCDSGEKKRASRSMPVHVTHFPGDVTNPHEKAEALSNCVLMHGKDHNSLVFIEVNDFFMFADSMDMNPIKTTASSRSGCAHQYRRILFGTNGQFLYDPVPVTKRFLFRVHDKDIGSSISPPPLLLRTSEIRESTAETLQNDFVMFLRSNRWESDNCKSNESLPANVAVYHYLRSIKECLKERGESSMLCSMDGTVEDQFGWNQVQLFLPEYSVFNDFL